MRIREGQNDTLASFLYCDIVGMVGTEKILNKPFLKQLLSCVASHYHHHFCKYFCRNFTWLSLGINYLLELWNVHMKRDLRNPIVNSFKLNFAGFYGFDFCSIKESHDRKERDWAGGLRGTHPCFIQSHPAFICFTGLHLYFVEKSSSD